MVRKLYIWILLMGLAFQGVGQELTANISSSRVGLNQNFEVSFSANGAISTFTPPSFDGFRVLGGPNQSTSIQIRNGRQRQTITYSYILRPTKTGIFNIGTATATVNGKKVSSDPLKVTVVKGQANQPKKQPKRQNNTNTQNIDVLIKKDLFLKSYVSNREPYQGEQLIITYKLYQRINLYSPQFEEPDFEGFWVEKVNLKNKQPTTETIDGKNYRVHTFSQVILFPQKSGKITINPMKVNCIVRVQKRQQNRRSFFDDFFGDDFMDPFSSYQNYRYNMVTNPVTLDVKSLPNPKPTEFDGIIGDFSFDVNVDKTETIANDPVTLSIKVSGKGNLQLLSDFDFDLPSDIETYEPKIKDNTSISASGLSGSKTFEYLLIPRAPGEFKIPPVEFTYFDPAKGQYQKHKSAEILLNVLKDDGTEYVQVPTVNKKDIELRGQDIQYIRLKPGNLKPRGFHFFGSWLFFVLLILPLLILVLMLLVKKHNEKLKGNTALLKKRKSTKVARKRLIKAKKYLNKGEMDAFYTSITTALNGYLTDKFSIPAADLQKESIIETLKQAGINDETIEKLTSLLADCEFAKFAPSKVDFNPGDKYNDAVKLISSIEKEV